MKKKILVVVIIFFVLLAGVLIPGVVLYNSDWADERSEHYGTASVGFKYYPQYEYNYWMGREIAINEEEPYHECIIECDIDQGAIILFVYNMNGFEFEEKDKFTLVREERIYESGTYTYDLSYLDYGSYYACIYPEDAELPDEDEYVSASGNFITKHYYTNWQFLRGRIKAFFRL